MMRLHRHVVGKGREGNRNEGLHSRLRDKLNRMHRRTKGYSKSIALLTDSIALVCVILKLVTTNSRRKCLHIGVDTQPVALRDPLLPLLLRHSRYTISVPIHGTRHTFFNVNPNNHW